MRLGIMQPYFFPYLGHFGLIAAVDRWIVFDTSQYTPRSWMNRNRVLHPKSGWQYVSLPLANGSIGIRTAQARLLDPPGTRAAVFGKLSQYRRAPYYHPVLDLVAEALDGGESLVEVNVRGLQAVCRYLGLAFDHAVLSAMGLDLPPASAGEWALEICTALGATGYVNPAGGRALFDPVRYASRGITLQFAETAEFRYQPRGLPYEPGLSILDTLMWNSPADVLAAIRTGTRLLA